MNEKGVVYKYPLNIGGTTVLELPVRSQLLSVKAQNDDVVAYFLINSTELLDDKYSTKYKFYTVGTGHSFTLDRGMEFWDTVLLHNDTFVLHVFKL